MKTAMVQDIFTKFGNPLATGSNSGTKYDFGQTSRCQPSRRLHSLGVIQGSCPFEIKFKDFSMTFKDHTKDL